MSQPQNFPPPNPQYISGQAPPVQYEHKQQPQTTHYSHHPSQQQYQMQQQQHHHRQQMQENHSSQPYQMANQSQQPPQQQLVRQQQHHHHHRSQQQQSNGMDNNQQNHHQSSQSHHSSSHQSSTKKHKKKQRRMLKTRVFASGYNYNYQFGLESNDNYPEIVELQWCQGLNISYICSGLTHLCYLSFTGNYYFCGQIDKEKLGIIEDNHNDNKIITKSNATPLHKFMPHNNNNNNDNNMRVSRIADGVSSRHMIIISTDFRAYSMGSNQRGQLGLGHFKSTLKFTEIEFEKSKYDRESYISFDIIDASCGESHSAFVVMPKCTLPIEQILSWYYFKYGPSSTLLFENRPSRIYRYICRYLIKYTSLLTESLGRLYVCGCNSFGQLGIGSSRDSGNKQMCYNKTIQVTSSNLSSVSIAQVSCGENHTICLDNRGKVYCFGDNYYGQSGAHLNHYENVYYPIKIEYFKKQYSARIVKVSSGKYHCCALDKLGRVFCWGLGAYGQLGCNKLNKRIILPIHVDTLQNEKVIDVRCGVYHTIALTNKGQLYCWGANNYGQCFQNINQENIITPKLAKIDYIQQQNLPIYKVFCGYYSTLILTHDSS